MTDEDYDFYCAFYSDLYKIKWGVRPHHLPPPEEILKEMEELGWKN